MPKNKKRYKGLGLLIYKGVGGLGVSMKEAAKKLHTSDSNLYKQFDFPPTDMDTLQRYSRVLKINLLLHYKGAEPLKSWLAAYEQEISRLKKECESLKKDKENLYYTIDLQKKLLGHDQATKP
jgi:hypothetical protein